MSLQPERNLYSVGPVGPNIIIARSIALRGGQSRENMVNLIAWLCIAGNVKPDEVADEIRKASTPIRPTAAVTAAKPATAVVVVPPNQTQPAPVATPDKTLPAPVARQVIPFIGDIDPQEAEALRESLEQSAALMEGGGGTPPVDGDALANEWGARKTGG